MRLSTWPAPKAAIFGCIALACTTLWSMFLYLGRSESEIEPEPITGNIEVIHELANITAGYSHNAANSTVGIVMASVKGEDLTWLLDYCKETNTIPFIYTTDAPPAPNLLVSHTTRGREAAAYLSYLIDYYTILPEYTLFVHSNPDQWHNDLFGPHTAVTLRNLRLDSVDAYGYVNLRCEHNPGCPIDVKPFNPTQIDIDGNDIRAVFPDVYATLFGVTREQVPREIGGVCCGQFAVSRKQILRRGVEEYERMLEWAATTTQTDSFGVGWVFEKVWHVVFGMQDVYCPRYEQCRCDAYGWCGPLPSGEKLQAVMNEL